MKKFRSIQFARVIILSFSSCLFACQKDKPDLPVVTTAIITEISNVSAVSGGNVTSIGGASVTARGICWNTSANPSIKNSHTTESGSMGTFTCNLTQLSPSTQYFVRAYATNSGGTAYGDELTLKTYHGTLTDIDGNVYYDVAIGNQIWMEKNLKTTRYSDGTPIPYANTQVLLNAITSASKAYCWYNLDIGNKDVYGALYTWPAAMNGAATSSEPCLQVFRVHALQAGICHLMLNGLYLL